MGCGKGGSRLAWVRGLSLLLTLLLLVNVAGSLPALPLIVPSQGLAQGVRSSNVPSTVNISEVFPISGDLALRFWAYGNAVDPWTLQSILIVTLAFLQEQISLHGDEAHPLNGGLEYNLDEDLEILIRKSPEDPDGLDWSELQAVVLGLWEYIVMGRRYRTVTFDILDTENDAQIGWGHIIKWERDSLSNRTAKRGLQISTPALPSSANSISGQRNSSLPYLLGGSIDWPLEDSDMTLRFSTGGTRGQALDPEAVRNLFIVLIEITQKTIAAEEDDAILGGKSFRYGKLVVLEVINSPHMLTWIQFAIVLLGLVDFMVDHEHFRSWYFTIFVREVEIGIGKIAKGIVPHNNFTVARRNAGDGGGVG